MSTLQQKIVFQDTRGKEYQVTLSYQSELSPLIIQFTFTTDNELITWDISRDLIVEYFAEGFSGVSDVRFARSGRAADERGMLILASPTGVAKLSFDNQELRNFLHLTHCYVQVGQEDLGKLLELALKHILQ